MGSTASGKSAVAIEIASAFGAEIVSVDSMQVYRGMDIGTAKPGAAEQRLVRHHLIDLADPEEPFSVAEFQAEGCRVLADLERRQVRALVVGGSGLHFRALVDPLEFPPSEPSVRAEVDRLRPEQAVAALIEADPGAGDTVDLQNPRRVARALEIRRITGLTPTARAGTEAAEAVRSYRPLRPFVGVAFDPGPALGGRIERRFSAMLDDGLLEEVRSLAPRLGPTASQAVGYKQLLPVVRGEWDLKSGRRRAVDATGALAGRQRTFFGRDPRFHRLEWDDALDVRRARALAVLEEAGWTS